ncbi:hypothetical protein J2790_001862 [Paenarthrobacter nicotinovorans]|nr:hypothetical protein [Paenarthrobacter nicotinovorans]SCZ56749.1 hypothetical protein SAMN02799638_01953 [Arthrobacter sp. UNCCL28]
MFQTQQELGEKRDSRAPLLGTFAEDLGWGARISSRYKRSSRSDGYLVLGSP